MTSPGRWQFDFSEPGIIVLAILLLISLLLVLHSANRRLVQHAPLQALVVMVLNIVAYGAVLLFLLEPRFSQTVEQSITLITEGTDLASISNTSPASLYVAPGVDSSYGKQKNLKSADWLLDIGQLTLREPALNAIEIHGYGLGQDQWQNFSNHLQIDFNPPAINGFTSMRWQRSLVEGETLVVSGFYQLPDSDAIIELHLLDPAANIVDESRINSGQQFSLSTAVKAPGNLEFKLQAWNAGILLSDQVVPVESNSDTRFNIMIRQSAPSFETRALKNYAAANGHRVRLNTDISKGKSLSQSANLPADVDTSFSTTVLAEQDMLIMDGRALVDLPVTQRKWLIDAVENGLGLLVLADSALLQHFDELNTNLLNGFHLAPLTDAETMVNPRLLTRGASDWQEPLQGAAMQLTADDADIFIDDGLGRGQVVRRPKGLGYISISLINHSHSWLTSGQRADWGDYWSTLFANLARQRGGSYLLRQAETDFYRVNQRTEVCVFTGGGNASVAIHADTTQGQQLVFELRLAPDTLNSPRQCVYFWPEAAGWQQIQLLSDDQESILDKKAIYVFQPDQWLAQQRQQRVQATRTKAIGSSHLPRDAPAKWVSEPISPFWLWLTLVLSGTILWLERKLDFR